MFQVRRWRSGTELQWHSWWDAKAEEGTLGVERALGRSSCHKQCHLLKTGPDGEQPGWRYWWNGDRMVMGEHCKGTSRHAVTHGGGQAGRPVTRRATRWERSVQGKTQRFSRSPPQQEGTMKGKKGQKPGGEEAGGGTCPARPPAASRRAQGSAWHRRLPRQPRGAPGRDEKDRGGGGGRKGRGVVGGCPGWQSRCGWDRAGFLPAAGRRVESFPGVTSHSRRPLGNLIQVFLSMGLGRGGGEKRGRGAPRSPSPGPADVTAEAINIC